MDSRIIVIYIRSPTSHLIHCLHRVIVWWPSRCASEGNRVLVMARILMFVILSHRQWNAGICWQGFFFATEQIGGQMNSSSICSVTIHNANAKVYKNAHNRSTMDIIMINTKGRMLQWYLLPYLQLYSYVTVDDYWLWMQLRLIEWIWTCIYMWMRMEMVGFNHINAHNKKILMHTSTSSIHAHRYRRWIYKIWS